MNKELDQWIYKNLPFLWENCSMSVEELIEHLQKNPHLLNEGEKEERKIQDPMTYAQSMAKKQMENFAQPTDSVGNDWGRPELLAADNTAISGQNWEEVAEEMLNKIPFTGSFDFTRTEAITALTEFGKMWYERGREEMRELYNNDNVVDTLRKVSSDVLVLIEGLEAAVIYIREKDIQEHDDPSALEYCLNTAYQIHDRYVGYNEEKHGTYLKQVEELQQQLAEKEKELEWYKQKLLLWESNPEKGALATLFLERESELTAAKAEIEKWKDSYNKLYDIGEGMRNENAKLIVENMKLKKINTSKNEKST